MPTIANAVDCHVWALRLGVVLPTRWLTFHSKQIEHPGGEKGTIEVEAVTEAALMSLRGESEAAIRTFLFDNTIFNQE